MIKLQYSLPNTITVGGREFLIKTDFRYWLMFDEIVSEKFKLSDLEFLFVDEIPSGDYSKKLLKFYQNPNSTPKGAGSKDVAFDYQEDGEYIYSSFWLAYGIDLFTTNLHWHQFKALFLGLPENTIMATIEGYRTYHKDNRKMEKIQEELKRIWTLPRKEDKEIIDELDELFYNS